MLKFPRLTFSFEAILCIGRAFKRVIEECRYTCYACAIMPDHIHILIRKHKHTYEERVWNLQRESQAIRQLAPSRGTQRELPVCEKDEEIALTDLRRRKRQVGGATKRG